jgi:2'-5' RNA ligase
MKNIVKEKLRMGLLKEGKHSHKNEYGCLMIYLDVDKTHWESIQNMIDDDDLYEPKDDPSYGREKEPHATILFGLHEDVKDEDIEKEIDKVKSPKVKVKGISSFKNKDFEVLKYDIDSKDMHNLNKVFKKFPHTNTFPDYHPHITIAYLKPNTVDKYIKKMNDNNEFKITNDKLVYSKVDGSKKTYPLNEKGE